MLGNPAHYLIIEVLTALGGHFWLGAPSFGDICFFAILFGLKSRLVPNF